MTNRAESNTLVHINISEGALADVKNVQRIVECKIGDDLLFLRSRIICAGDGKYKAEITYAKPKAQPND